MLNVKLSWFLCDDVLNKLIKTEILCALSMNHIDTDDVICINKGIIILSLTKETYEKAGLVGKPSAFSKISSRWNVTLDMRDSSMKKGKKGFNRILWSFENNFLREFSFKISALNEDDIKVIEEVVGLSSRLAHFEDYESGQILCPSFSYPEEIYDLDLNKIIRREWAMEIYEWLGLVSLRADKLRIQNKPGPYISTYHISNALEGEVMTFLWSGMISCTWILNIWTSLLNIQDMNWFSLTVNGFEDSPISWENCEHGYFYGGENTYTLLKLSNNSKKPASYNLDNIIPHFIVYEYVNSYDQPYFDIDFMDFEKSEVPETAHELISRIEEAKNCKNNSSKSISKHTFILKNGVKINSWKLPEFGSKKTSKIFLDIRGLFSITNKQNLHEIVIRGYNKFFAVNEVEMTKWETLERLTKGPYTLTLKENGCIIFISALADLSLIVASKHFLGPSACGISSHAQMGEIWLDRHLSSVGRTREQLASVLREKNVTLVSELCDDSFEEHIIEYPPEKRGLYLHGINKNEPIFSTAPFDEVFSFGIEWGFKQVDFMIFESLLKLKDFIGDSEKLGSYHGKEVEGFVIRCKSKNSDEDTCFRDFFFKYKFKEPYFLYRRWREVTRAIISNTYKFNTSDIEITKQYAKWVRLLLKKEPDLSLEYKQNHGIVALRKRFLEEYNYSHSDLAELLTTTAIDDLEDRNILLVTIGTIGCGKTTLALALSSLFGFGHIQNDNIVGKKTKIHKFATKIAEALMHYNVVVADKNNHKFIERKELIHLVSELSPDTRFIALYYYHYDKDISPFLKKQELNKVLKVTQDRVLARGNNHQTIDASPNKIKAVLGIMNGFLSRFEPLDRSKEPDSLFEDVIVLDPTKDTRYNLEIVVNKLYEIIPRYITEIPTSSQMDHAIFSALNDYCPGILPSLSCFSRVPEYFAIVLKDNLALYIEEIMRMQTEEKRMFWEHLKSLSRVQHTFHVTLIHISEKLKYSEIWNSYLSRIDNHGVICQASVEFTHLVWNSRIMALAAKIIDSQKKKLISVNPYPHATIGTENKTILPKESNDLLCFWKSHPHDPTVMSLTLTPRLFSGTAVAVYPAKSTV
ncbi:hypothetical protein PMAC_002110 [Pneumocystis sp. 'macacae']|nr:hypothetical protein PMAC_002110 [Pneumocystis sp. 'macacae']